MHTSTHLLSVFLFLPLRLTPIRSNWSVLTLMVSSLGAVGGILVAATLKYADAILKTLATAGSIVISTVFGHFLLNGPLDMIMVIGGLTVIIAIFNYTMDTTSTTKVNNNPVTADTPKDRGSNFELSKRDDQKDLESDSSDRLTKDSDSDLTPVNRRNT